MLCSWKHDTPLSELTKEPVDALHPDFMHVDMHSSDTKSSLARSTRGPVPSESNRLLEMKHEALGQIWRGLGLMTIACAGRDIQPEILEMIAFLHHKELMPLSIYGIRPSDDSTAIQQSPMLNILS